MLLSLLCWEESVWVQEIRLCYFSSYIWDSLTTWNTYRRKWASVLISWEQVVCSTVLRLFITLGWRLLAANMPRVKSSRPGTSPNLKCCLCFQWAKTLRSCYKKVWACHLALPQDHTVVQLIYIYSAVLEAIASRLVEHSLGFISMTSSLDCSSWWAEENSVLQGSLRLDE